MGENIIGDSDNRILLLYVDDEAILLSVTKQYLERIGDCTVHTASSAKEALKMIQEVNYDAVVSDYQMPEMDGLEFLKTLRAEGNTIPFIIFTGRGREEVAIEALNAGADFYLQKGGKPQVQFAELRNFVRQVVEKNRAEKCLLEHERRMADVINFLPDATFAVDVKGRVIAWNRATEQMTNIPASEMLGKGNYECALPFYGKRRPILADIVLNKDIRTEVSYPVLNGENREKLFAEIFIPHLRGGEGAYLWFTASPLYDAEGNVAGAIESIRDITEYKQAEGLYKAVFENTGTAMAIIEDEVTISHVNKKMKQLLGYSGDESKIFANWQERVVEEDRENILKCHRLRRTEPDSVINSYDCRMMHRNGEIINVNLTAAMIPGTKKNIVSFIDITAEKKAEQALHESEYKFREIFNSANDIIFLNEIIPGEGPGRFIEVNDATCRSLGYSREDLLSMSLKEILTSKIIDNYGNIGDQLRNKGKATFEAEGIRKDGTVITLENCSSLFMLNNQLVHLCVGRDITERKNVEQALRASEIKFREIFNSTGDIIFLNEFPPRGPPGRFIEVNNAACMSLGYTREEMLRMSMKDIEGPETRDKYLDIVNQFRTKGNATFEAKAVTKDGTTVTVENHACCFMLDNRLVNLSVGRDITERKNAENALKTLNKKLNILSSITRHDISNQVGVLMGYEEMLEGEIGEGNSRVYLKPIIEATERIQDQIAFTRDYQELGVHSPTWQSVESVARSVVPNVSDIGIQIRIDTGTLEIFADHMLEKVFYNLFENAVRHGEYVTDISVSFHVEEGNVIVVIEDNGAGVAGDMKEMIFDRGVGSNTGFGLFLTREILDITGISISETGTEGKGARFEITVPKYGYRYES